jgi:hypothetical protein
MDVRLGVRDGGTAAAVKDAAEDAAGCGAGGGGGGLSVMALVSG